jgi:hypothetical protein
MSKFESAFKKLLSEQDVERAAMQSTLDKDVDASEFDIDTAPSPDTEALAQQSAELKTAQAKAIREKLVSWVERCDDFISFLNGTDPDSIQYQLAHSEPDTLFDRMKQSEQRKLSRVATELASLTESLRGYIAQTEDPSFKYV